MKLMTTSLTSRFGQKCKTSGLALATMLLAMVHISGNANQMQNQNLVQLMNDSQNIVVGSVANVTDGFDDNNIPYTEITINVASNLKGKNRGRGKKDETYTFRQFGLTAPKKLPDGKTYLVTTPEGWAKYHKKESVMLFLREPARLTGLQTTAGLSQGKFSLVNGQYMNAFANKGLMEKVAISAPDLNEKQKAMLSGEAVFDAKALTDLISRAVNENWIENGVMRNEK